MKRKPQAIWCLAVCVRARVAAFAMLAHDGTVLLTRRRFLKHALLHDRPSFAVAALRKLAAKYAVGTVVLEPGCLVDNLVSASTFRIHRLYLADAKAVILGAGRKTHATLCSHLIDRDPKLARLVRLLEGNRVSEFRPADNVQLFAVALGLASQIRAALESIDTAETLTPVP